MTPTFRKSLSFSSAVSPLSLTRVDRAGRITDEIEVVRRVPFSRPREGESYPQTSWSRWTQHCFDDRDRHEWTRVYHAIPAHGAGTAGRNYDQTRFGYDALYRRDVVVTPGGTVQRTRFDIRGLPIEVKLGALQTGPALPGGVLSRDRLVAKLEYDRGASGGNGYLTRLDQYVDDSEVRTTLFGYDWRGDQTSMKRPTENEEVLQEHDFQGQLVERRDVQRGYVVGALHDVRGRTYRVVQQFRRTRTGDFVGWVDNIWRDAAGNVLAHESNAGRAFTKFAYDGLGQVTAEYLGTPAARMTEHGQAARVAGDILFEQREYRYNEAGNLVWTTRRRRSPAAVARGPLRDEQSDPQARVDHSAMWYDTLGRLRAQADFGANGQTSMDPPLVIPQRSDAVLVTRVRSVFRL